MARFLEKSSFQEKLNGSIFRFSLHLFTLPAFIPKPSRQPVFLFTPPPKWLQIVLNSIISLDIIVYI